MRRLLLLPAVLIGFCGCDQIFDSGRSSLLERAEREYKSGNFRAAAEAYESAIDGTAATADAHYRLALIYESKLNNPLGAVHHLQRYLELAPKGSFAKDARETLRSDEHKLMTKLSRGALMTQEDAARLKNENLRLNSENASLRAQLKAAPTPPVVASGGKPAALKQKPVPSGSRTYVVQPKDSLASISRRFYKTPARWKDIQDANFFALEGTVTIKPGMTLIIPK